MPARSDLEAAPDTNLQVAGPRLNRRTVLAATGGTAVLAACAACGSSSSSTTSTTSSSSSSNSSSAAGGSGGTVLAKVSDVPASTGLVVDGPSGKVLLAVKDGTVVAHTAVCTHQGGIVAADGVCPLHGSKFDITTGAVENGPATSPLAAITVTETGGNVVTA